MTEPLFTVGALVAEPLDSEDAVALRELFGACDGTSDLTCGVPAGTADDPRDTDTDAPAVVMSIGIFEGEDTAGIIDVSPDAPAPGSWTIGLFMVESGRRGAKLGHEVLTAFGDWARGRGAERLFVGIPETAEAFWYEAGFEPADLAEDDPMRAEGLLVLERELA